MGSGSTSQGSFGSGSSFPILFNWQHTLTPWQKALQPTVTSELTKKGLSDSGMTPQQEASLWGAAKQQLEETSMGSGRNYARQLASSGISPNSPAAAGGWSDLFSSKIKSGSQMASDFIKTKLGQSNTAVNQMLTALFTPAPTTVGQVQTTSQTGAASGSSK